MDTSTKIIRTYNRAVRKLRRDRGCVAVAVSVGFLNGKTPWLMEDETGAKMQVFIKVCRFSEKLLKEKRRTGGLLEFA